MKKTIFSICGLSVGLTLLWGCGGSNSDTSKTDQKTSPAATSEASTPPGAQSGAMPERHGSNKQTAETTTAPTAPPGASAPSVTTPPPVAQPRAVAANTSDSIQPPALPTVTSTASNTVSQFLATSKAKGDKVLTSVSSDLAEKMNALAQSAGGNDALKTQLTNSLKSFVSGNDAAGLTTLYQTAQSAALTPSQLQLAKDVGNLASAYVVQKNFASLEGSQGDVATIVSSLREGQITPAIPALQKVAQNASLTPPQKELVGSIADKYAPGVSKAAGLLQQGLQRIPSLGGSGK